MPTPPVRRRLVLNVEALETRETPSASATSLVTVGQNFNTTPVGALPSGWSQWSAEKGFVVSTHQGLGGSRALTSTSPTDQSARAWVNAPAATDETATVSMNLSSLVPGLVFVRGSNLNSTHPTYYALYLQRGLYAQLLKVVDGQLTVLGTISTRDILPGQWVTATLSANGDQLKVQISLPGSGKYLSAGGVWQKTPTWALQRTDTTITAKGQAGVGRYPGHGGTLAFDNFSETYANPATSPTAHKPTGGKTGGKTSGGTASKTGGKSGGGTSGKTTGGSRSGTPGIPQHYDWIRIAELAYSALPIGSFEDQLLRNSVDLVVSDLETLSQHIHDVSPSTPQLAYSNASNLYLNLLTDWLNYADAHGVSREGAFYHAAHPTPFSGDSGSSQPVNWFWGVYQAGVSADFLDLTTAAHDRFQGVPFSGSGTSMYIGYPEKFREINVNLTTVARDGWSAVLEYPTAVDSQGNPTAWAPLRTITDTTFGLAHSGQITFDPPANWKTSIAGSDARLFYVRFRTVSDGRAPVASSILGRDYVGAHGTTHGVIPAFDYSADKDHDGYLNNAEYAHRRRGYDARFVYESRVFYGYYGQERFAANPSNANYRNWAVDYSLRVLNSHPVAKGLFMDNSGGNPTFVSNDILESTSSYATDYGAMLAAINRAIAPRWILANTSGGSTAVDGVVQQTPGYFEEFALRPLANSWQQFEQLAATVAHRAGLRNPSPIAVLDSLPTGGSPTDSRTQLATLAYYYLLQDPKTTFLDPFGGFEPGTSWNRHWLPAATYNVGQPTGEWSVFASGNDPSNYHLTYRVYQRSYTNALVLYKPLSYAQGANNPGSLGSGTATTHYLGGTYRLLRANGSLGSPVTSITLRNGEGAILIRV
jgi:hypothetical protein